MSNQNIELTGRIVTPGNPEYNSAREEFNTFFNKFPLIIVFAQNTQDVVNAVRWSRQHNVPMRMRSGRHNYEGLSVNNAGIVIDVSEMKQLEIDHNGGTVTIGTGWRNLSLTETLAAEGLVVPSGVCPTPGIAGVTLGGGHSILSRPWGLTLDHLIELEMVDANGCIIRANANHNSDLYWAYRGAGGGNFGICTSFKFRTHKINTVGFAEISWDLKDLKSVLNSWQEYTLPCADKRFTSTLFMSSGVEPSLLMQGVFLGSVQELQALLQPLLQAGSPLTVTIEEIPWVEAATRIAATQPIAPLPFKSVGPYLYALLPEEALTIIEHFINNSPQHATTSLFFHGLGGAVADVSNDSTAYFYRKALSNMSIFSTWDQEEGAAASIRWTEDFRLAMLPYTKGVYVNTPDLSIKDWPDAYYSCNFDRLMEVKAKYDPKNIFNFPQSIPPF
ncbi:MULTISPECIES: FAD-binding oxidoreductase [Bacillus]|uniref:FAD/FMN-containing dehydrogenase n=1 Tax=Bacillus mycoides TaxID=1405 RepID=A0A3D9TY19_BACMY|nr:MULTISPECIES: FAD-binding oxidoreductase [Bacillus]RBP25210.1 FAD/FMN-containing dehydrogenase [Bacillus sp. DB-2]REF19185.1 FAD/FMN-containing dehydrogenase [Bacillus mycoides]